LLSGPDGSGGADRPGDIGAQVEVLRGLGCDYVLLTTADEPGVNGFAATTEVVNTLYGPDGLADSQSWSRLPGNYHGSGCTMASALAGLLARGVDIRDAARRAQAFTWQALRASLAPGHGQRLPDRLYWADPQGNQEQKW